MSRHLRIGGLLLGLLVAYGPQVGAKDDPLVATGERDAAALIAAFDARDRTRFDPVAAAAETDPWSLVDVLLVGRRPDVATAYATAVGGPDTAQLPQFIFGRQGRPVGTELRQAVVRAELVRDRESAKAALAGLEEAGDPGGVAWALENRAEVLSRQGRASEARATLERALGLVDGGEEPVLHARLRRRLGALLLQGLQLDRAMAQFEASRQVFVAAHDEAQLASVLGAIALVHAERGEYDRARAML